MTKSKKDYEVGYGKPPKDGQFKPGQSGNPKGRPTGTRNLKTDLQDELSEKVQVTSGGKTQTVSKQRAMLMRTSELAMKGNIRAIELLTKLALQHLDDDAQTTTDAPLNADEEAIFNGFLEQQSKSEPDKEPAE